MEQNRITPVTTAGCFAAIMLVLALLSTYVPFFSIVGYFIMPIPVAIIYMKFGLRWAVMMGAVVGILMGIFINPAIAIVQVLAFGGVGVALGAGFRHDWSPLRMLIGVTAALAISFIITTGAMYLFMDFNFWQFTQEQFQTVNTAIIESYKESGMTDAELLNARAEMDMVMTMLPSLIPLMTCLALFILSYANIKIAQMVLRALGYAVRPFLPIRYWEISRIMLYLYVLAKVMNYWGASRDIGWLNILGMNVEQFAVFFISIQGIAFLLFLLDNHFKIKSAVQAVIVILALVIPLLQVFVFVAGLVDMLMGYRRKQNNAA